ncbi:MAG: TolC family protein, partial [Bacteroidota bacterium]|nr:TolC family protein [Bacteroidota bacterium]
QLVIRQYQDVLLKQRILSIKSDGLSNAKLNMDMVQKEFSNGTIPVSEYVRISEIVDRAKTEYETAKTDFITVKMILEDFIGFTLNNTENQAK